MKNILLAFVTASCCATAATVDDSYWGISDYNGASSEFDINNTSSSLTISEDYLVSGATFSTQISAAPYNNRVMYAITYVLNLAKLDTPAANVTLFSDYTDATNKGVGFALTTNRSLAGTWQGNVWSPNTSKNQTNFNITLGNSDTAVVTFVMGYDKTGADVYINGTAAGSASGLSHSKSVTQLQLSNNEAIESIYFHKYDQNNLFDADAASSLYTSITASVPEPTTATLSLLALAGLAVRRRRK